MSSVPAAATQWDAVSLWEGLEGHRETRGWALASLWLLEGLPRTPGWVPGSCWDMWSHWPRLAVPPPTGPRSLWRREPPSLASARFSTLGRISTPLLFLHLSSCLGASGASSFKDSELWLPWRLTVVLPSRGIEDATFDVTS